MNTYPFSIDVNVHWSDMDALGHVNNARYFTYIESCRIAFLQQAGLADMWNERYGPILASASCQFKKPITYPSTVKVGLWLGRIGNSSFAVNHDLVVGDTLMARAETIAVWCDYQAGKPEPLSEAMRKAIQPYLREA